MNKPTLLNHKMKDGSRKFMMLPEEISFDSLHKYTTTLQGADVTEYIWSVVECWIDFSYDGHQFSINNQFGEYWFFVDKPHCPDEILNRVAGHFAKILK